MSDPSLGTWLRKERERRGISIRAISDQTKVSAPLLEGLEADNISRWPEGIYRRAFVRAYATAIGLDPDEVARRFDQEHGPSVEPALPAAAPHAPGAPISTVPEPPGAALPHPEPRDISRRARVLGTTADLTVALVLAMGSAAAGSRLLWPVLLIAAYYALGVLLTGTSPMVALLHGEQPIASAQEPPTPNPPDGDLPRVVERRHQHRRNQRPGRPQRSTRPRVQ